MSADTEIEWATKSWNPVRGCNPHGPGCLNCYAVRQAARHAGPGRPYAGLVRRGPDERAAWSGRVRTVEAAVQEPFGWMKPEWVFVNSMSDLFHPAVPDEFVARVARVMAAADRHAYLVLTKRADRMADLLGGPLRRFAGLPHVFWGVSCEDRAHGLQRLAALRRSGAARTMVSCEPLLEDLGAVDMAGVGWVIVGGESGQAGRIRRMNPEWAAALRDRCGVAGVPFFFKQQGGAGPGKGGPLLDGQVCRAFPAVPGVPPPVPAPPVRRPLPLAG